MRKIKATHCTAADQEGGPYYDAVIVRKSEYALLLAVARECDLYDKQRSSMADIRAAMDKLNATPRKP